MTHHTFESISPTALETVTGGADDGEPVPTPAPDPRRRDQLTTGGTFGSDRGDQFTTGGRIGGDRGEQFTTGGRIGGENEPFTTGGSF